MDGDGKQRAHLHFVMPKQYCESVLLDTPRGELNLTILDLFVQFDNVAFDGVLINKFDH